jgi:hypothetical protein
LYGYASCFTKTGCHLVPTGSTRDCGATWIFIKEGKLAGLKVTSKEYGPRGYFVWGIRAMLADLEVKGHVARSLREDFDAYVDCFHAQFVDCSKLCYCPCGK